MPTKSPRCAKCAAAGTVIRAVTGIEIGITAGSATGSAANLPGRSLGGELTFYTRDDFAGRSLTVRNGAADLRERDFNDTVQSVRVRSGYWEVCEDVDFRGRCRTLGPGEYASLERLSNRISSVREVR